MEDISLKQPTMVSRLPKFGFRATPVSGPITNGSDHVSSGWAKGVPSAKQNTMVRAAGKERRVREDCEETVPDYKVEVQAVVHSQQEPHSVLRQVKKPSAPSVVKDRRFTATIPSSIPRNTVKTKPRSSVCKQPLPVQPLCRRVGVTVAAVNKKSSSSSRVNLQDSLSHSSDSIRSISVDNVVRSQSFSYLKRPEGTTDQPLTRSFSFNRATELAKQMPRPLAQSPEARSPVTQPAMMLDHVTKPTIPAGSISSKPTSMLKKSLLPGASNGKPSLLSYKLMRPSIHRQPRPVLPVKGKMELLKSDRFSPKNTTPVSEPFSHTDRAESPPEEHCFNTETSGGHGHSHEISEDMSLSSTSSLERNDVTEEYMDDFDDLGNGLLFMSETVDWPEIGLTGSREAVDVLHASGARVMCVEKDLQHGSSLELSPSDSSGGTYMWDEEVLEPIGRAAQLCESFDSNLNSMNVLNNSCDLDEDDLMLDVDLPEDVSLHSDGDVALCHDQSNYWSWSKTRQCRGETKQIQHLEQDGANSHTLRFSRSESGHLSLDELMLKHMAQDCTSVKEQLFRLRMLLQVEEDGSVDEVEQLSSSSSEDSRYQVQELLHQLQKLRAELQEKDTLIFKLTQQLCVCQQGAVQRAERQDSSTQTTLRQHNSPILQRSKCSRLGRASCQMSSAAHSEFLDAQPADGSVNFPDSATRPFSMLAVSTAAASGSSCSPNSDNLILLLNSRFRVDESRNCVQLKNTQQPVLLKSGGCPELGYRQGVPCPDISAPSSTRHLPPPSHSAASQSSVISTRSTKIRTISSTKHEQSGSTRTQELNTTSNSRLPKPKSH